MNILYIFALFILMISELKCMESNKADIKAQSGLERAIFAGGCFWCMEPVFQDVEGVVDVISGYTGGRTDNPSYEDVCSGVSGHYEAVEVLFEQKTITYEKLLDLFWKNIDPADEYGQFVDKGSQYKSAIFYIGDKQKRLAEDSKIALEKSGKFNKPIATEILPEAKFYPAEDYHQDFYKTNTARYNFYKAGSGREKRLREIWKDDEKVDRIKSLTPLQYKVTQECGTEPPFNNEYWDNKREGIYVDVVSGKPLFSSVDKFDSGTGWPSFTKPLLESEIAEIKEKGLWGRIEVRSKTANSHLGHVFEDGPAPAGMRYCINSAALKFIPKEDLEKEGYGEYLKLFK